MSKFLNGEWVFDSASDFKVGEYIFGFSSSPPPPPPPPPDGAVLRAFPIVDNIRQFATSATIREFPVQ